MNELHDDAVVLRTYKSGEADRVVVLWTRQHGKVRVLAKGVRKTTSRLGATLETLAYVHVDLVKTRGEFYIARHVAHREHLATLRGSYPRISAGYAVVEAVDAIPSDGVPDEEIFDLLTRVLLTLDDDTYEPALVPASFYLRLLGLDGSEPVIDSCVNCGRPGPLVAFDAEIGGTLCDHCRQGASISPEAWRCCVACWVATWATCFARRPRRGRRGHGPCTRRDRGALRAALRSPSAARATRRKGE